MKGFGFTRFAADLFTAPDVVKQYLCNVARLHQVPIGSSRTNDLYDSIRAAFASTPYKLYLTDKYRVQFTVSKYGSHEVIGQQSELRSSIRLFTSHTSPLEDKSRFEAEWKRLRDKERELADRRNGLNQQRTNIHKEKEALKALQVEWRTRRDELTNLERSLSNRESNGHYFYLNVWMGMQGQFFKDLGGVDLCWLVSNFNRLLLSEGPRHLPATVNVPILFKRLERLSANRPDIDQARSALIETKRVASKEVHETALKVLYKLEKMRSLCVEESLLGISLRSLRGAMSDAEEELSKLQEKRSEDLVVMEGRATLFRSAKEDLDRAVGVLHELCGLKTLDERKMDAEEKKIIKMLGQLFIDENIPDEKAALHRLLEEEKAKLDIASMDGSKEDVDRCEHLQKEKSRLLERKQQQEVTREAWKATLMKEIAEWREPVEELIRKINVNYSKFFATLGCAGEVYLEVPEDSLNIDGYGIMIMVSFRSGERLRRLDHQVQSGGERSVSTMLYLLALQELCPVPFRCVDEINQGMDPVNERKVFDIMVDTLSGEGNLAKTQYFL
ncbi:unnamed protein product [Heligmosomoides polygyrus]|uniref:Structural maintenance of chromosomes protein 5 n=1 Tax=Heligmosomoides polygyrus TaxID=6339 RepID=A0A183F4Q5_HELPZ|nr:unnamed protein product [Heligmosomoides polygyrus]